jgi:hypothetical protein
LQWALYADIFYVDLDNEVTLVAVPISSFDKDNGTPYCGKKLEPTYTSSFTGNWRLNKPYINVIILDSGILLRLSSALE